MTKQDLSVCRVTCMVKRTIRFPEAMTGEVGTLVDDGPFESKSEFYRFASDFLLDATIDDYEPKTIDYEDIKSELINDAGRHTSNETLSEELSFFQSFVTVRRMVLRGKISDAEDFIDHHYPATHPHALMLEWVIHELRPENDGDLPATEYNRERF